GRACRRGPSGESRGPTVLRSRRSPGTRAAPAPAARPPTPRTHPRRWRRLLPARPACQGGHGASWGRCVGAGSGEGPELGGVDVGDGPEGHARSAPAHDVVSVFRRHVLPAEVVGGP